MYDSSPTLPLAPPPGNAARWLAMGEGAVVAERFVIEQHAGLGGMGDVFRAVDRQTGKRVALKLLRQRTEEHVARFQREARLLAALRHPAIVQYVAHGETDDGRHYLAMEWLEGEDLATRLRKGPLGVADSLAVAGRIAEALVAVHGQGVVHRDLKPANVFLPGGDPARAMLIDFGIARPEDTVHQLTSSAAILGTPAYMAPEQIQGACSVDVRSDVYSLGAILFECLTGRPPFVGPHVMAVLAKVLCPRTSTRWWCTGPPRIPCSGPRARPRWWPRCARAGPGRRRTAARSAR
jgi:serine/threonine protein kinase